MSVSTRYLLLRGIVAPVLIVSLQPLSGAAQEDAREEVVVTATRSTREANALPVKINTFDRETLQQQQNFATNTTEILANLVPSYSPGRQKMTNSGESFRGRRPLFLIDGVPQSNPLRDGRRDGVTLAPEMIERMEVVFGANAIQGLGATGGIVNYVTLSPPQSGELEQRLSFSMSGSDNFDGDAVNWRGFYSVGKRSGAFDFLAAATLESNGVMIDGEGNTIGIDSVQGDVADSDGRNLVAKLGWEPDESQRLQVFVSDYRLEQNGDYLTIEGDREAGIPVTSVPGEPEGIAPLNDVTTASLNYSHRDLLGGRFSTQIYYQDFSALFGGGRFGTFQDPRLAPAGEWFDQSRNNSEKMGSRLTYARSKLLDTPVGLVTGFDVLRDETYQDLALSGRKWVPVSTFVNYAPFLQLETDVTNWLSLSGGLRWELAELDAPDFETLAGVQADLVPVAVAGGSPSFDKSLVNAGAVLRPAADWRVYGTYSEAFSMPDVGRVLRGITAEGTSVAEFLDLSPVITDNVEVGVEYRFDQGRIQLTWFTSSSDFGSRLQANDDGIYEVLRQATETRGWEASGHLRPAGWLGLGIGYSRLQGEYDDDGDGRLETDLGAADIGPDRLNLALDFFPDGDTRGRLQVFRYFGRGFYDGGGEEQARFDGYTTADASITTSISRVELTASVSNLLDKQYISYYGQASGNRDDRYFSGRGRTLSLQATMQF